MSVDSRFDAPLVSAAVQYAGGESVDLIELAFAGLPPREEFAVAAVDDHASAEG